MPAQPTNISVNLFLPAVIKCCEVLASVRWPDGRVVCPVCRSRQVKKNGSKKGVQRYYCYGHEGTFSVTTGTVFYRSKVGLSVFFYFIFHYLRNESAKRLGEVLDVSYPTALRMAHKTLELAGKPGKTKLSGITEWDELYIACGRKGVKKPFGTARKRGLKLRGRGTVDKDKPPILGGCDRGGRLRVHVAGHATSDDIEGFFLDSMQSVSDVNPVYTDDFTAYRFFQDTWIPHATVNHSAREYARGDVHNNTMEGYWSVCRPWLDTYRGVSNSHILLYVGLFEFVENNRHQGWWNIFTTILFFFSTLYLRLQ